MVAFLTFLENNPISTVNGSARVTIALTGTSNYIAGQQISISGATAVGGITLSGDYVIQQANPTSIIITHGSAATSTATGGGAGVTINARIKIKMFGVLKTETLGADPISTTSGSPIVTIADTAHGLSVGDVVTFSGATAVGGITVSGSYPISSVLTNTFTIIASSDATSTATGGATEVLQGFVNQGLGEISKEVSDGEFKPITLEQVGNEALQNAYVGTLAGGALATPLASITAVGEYRNRNKLTPEQTMQHVQNINENVRSNKLFQRSQEAFKSLADSVAGDEKLYVNAQAALDTINSLDLSNQDDVGEAGAIAALDDLYANNDEGMKRLADS